VISQFAVNGFYFQPEPVGDFWYSANSWRFNADHIRLDWVEMQRCEEERDERIQ